MNVKEAIQLLNESKGMHVYDVFIPSVQKEISFKPITTGQQKTLSKFSMNANTFNLDYEFMKLALFDELKISNEPITSNDLTELDMVCFLAGIRLNNIMEPLEIICKCGECDNKFEFKIDLDTVIQKCKGLDQKEFLIKTTIDDIRYELTIKYPTYKSLIELEEYINLLSKELSYNEDQTIESRLFLKPAFFIYDLKINEVEVENFNTLDFLSKIEMYNELPPTLTILGENSILNLLLTKFNLQETSSILNIIKCPKCKHELEGVLSNDSFFII